MVAKTRSGRGCRKIFVSLAVSMLTIGVSAYAEEPAGGTSKHVYFGDLHLHTSYSLDAAAAKTKTTPDDAYRYAKGESVVYLGNEYRRRAPLDFLAVTDHAEYLGNVRLAMNGEIDLPGEGWSRLFSHDGGAVMVEFMTRVVAGLVGESTPGLTDPARIHGNWVDVIEAAERHYEPGTFTSLVGFEYSPTRRSATGGVHLHRNVIFRGPRYPEMPFAATDSLKPEALWAYADNNRRNGIESLMIPHNTNLSYGEAYATEDSYGEPISADYARTRARNEPLVEITQMKGTSETRPEISPNDEFADFELLDSGKDQPAGSYVRPALMRGLEISEKIGVNPFEQGFVGASDFHSGISSTEEDNFPGALGLSDTQRDPNWILTDVSPILGSPLAELSASGITGVWAQSNTRESIFDALQRREVFATSGPRIRVRMLAGWSDAGALDADQDWDRAVMAGATPMGGTLSTPPAGSAAPHFKIQAVKDPLSGNLDRIQIVKLWRKDGKSFEAIHDVAWSGERQPDPQTGRLPAVGNTVNAQTATYTNTIGDVKLVGSWSDSEFDPAQQAIYYARVLEIPTPRWATYLSVRSGIPLAQSTPAWLQERAWTSPVYFKP